MVPLSQSPGAVAWRRVAPVAWLVLLTLVVYAPTIDGAFIWDDDEYIT